MEFDIDTLKILESLQHTPRKPFTSKGKANVRAKRIEFEHIMPAHRALADSLNVGKMAAERRVRMMKILKK